MSTPVPRRLITLALLLALIALPLILAAVAVSRWLQDHREAQAREEEQERKMQLVRWRLHAAGIAVEQLALGHITLLEAVAWERALKLSQPQRGGEGARPPKAGRAWTAEEDALLMHLPGVEVARRTGRSIWAVHSRRRKLKLPDGRRKG